MGWFSRILKKFRAYIAGIIIVFLAIILAVGVTVPDETNPPPDETNTPSPVGGSGGSSEETIEVFNTIEIRRSSLTNLHVYTIPDETKIISESNVEEYFVSPTENSIVFFRTSTRDHGATLYTIPDGNQIDEVTIGVYEVQFSPPAVNGERNGVVLLATSFSPDDAAFVYSLPDGGDQIAEITAHVLEVRFSPAGNAVGLFVNNPLGSNFGAFVYSLPGGEFFVDNSGGLVDFWFDEGGQNVILVRVTGPNLTVPIPN